MDFIKVGSACPKVKVGDVKYNVEQIKNLINKALENEVKVLIFPELSVSSYTCSDLFTHSALIKECEKAILDLVDFSRNKDILISVGSPLLCDYNLYNCAYIILNGKILGIVPKSYIPNYSEFYEKRWFTEGLGLRNLTINISSYEKDIPFGTDLIFSYDDLKIGFEICEDLWVAIPPSSYLALNGANLICNLSASNELVSKSSYRRELIKNQSARTISSYIYTSSGVHESTTDLLFSGHMLICENGAVLNENKRFNRENELITGIVDLFKLDTERMKNISFRNAINNETQKIRTINFEFKDVKIKNFNRFIDKHPFVPSNKTLRDEHSLDILNIQCAALAKRLEHTNLKKAVIGISGGLDSTLALLVVIKTFDMLKIPRKNILTITMPGFGTTDRTYNNAIILCKELGCSLREINIVEAALLHFKDIGHDKDIHDVTYENVQARERTQILMDIANKDGGLLIGTGDLSELALGWCTYNGDHMSMYSVNCSIPKTLVRYLVRYFADNETAKEVSDTLLDILDTPVSPELLPKSKEGKIAQKTEDIVGPYELHDFFLYHFIKHGSSRDRILFLACIAFKNDYDKETIEKWLNKFITRFFTQQFKRSALPDGPKVGSISLSPRGDWRMPSDASYNSFI